MTSKMFSALALAGIAAAALTTAAVAEKGPKGAPEGPMMLQRFDELDADKDGKVTEAEIAAWHAARFAAADTDGNGQLSAEELTAMQVARMQERMAERSAGMIEKLDANGDGQLSAEEMAKMGKRETPFERADADGDGGVSKEEAMAAMDHGKKGDKKHGKRGGGDHDGRGPGGGWWWDIN